MNRVLTILLAILTALQPLRAAEPDAPTDTVRFEPRQLIAPVAMIAAGSLCVSLQPLKQARTWVSDEIGLHRCSPADDVLQYLPAAGYLFLDFAGVKSRRPFVDRLIVGATATILMTALTQGPKHIINERRPDGGRHSFPSGHSATAFMGAELLRQDYGPWVGAAGYAVATGVGIMRILNRRHWLNDVVAGAGVGILCAKAGEWLLPFNRRWLGLDRRRGQDAAIVPTYSPADGAVALNAVIIF